MDINTKEDWVNLARETIPLLPDYMQSQSGNINPDMVLTELTGLLEAGNLQKLHGRFEEIWAWLPDRPDIRVKPFFDLCDLCSESWAIYED